MKKVSFVCTYRLIIYDNLIFQVVTHFFRGFGKACITALRESHDNFVEFVEFHIVSYGSLKVTRMKCNIIYLSGGRQKSYLAAARRDKLSGGREKNYLTAAIRVRRVSKNY